MRTLILGGRGQLGLGLARHAALNDIEVVSLGRNEVDITTVSEVRAALSATRADVVINAAAYTKVDLAESEPEAALKANRDGPAVLSTEAAAAGIPFVHVSTDYVFDGTKRSPYREGDPVAPLGVYGRSKEAGERAVRECCPRHVIIRTAWVYGPDGANFLKTMLRLAGERPELAVVGDQHGNPTSTEDLAVAIFAAARRAVVRGDCWGTFHFAGQGDATWHDFASKILAAYASVTGHSCTVRRILTSDYPTRARRPANSRLESAAFASRFGVTARDWRDVVGPTVAAVLAKQALQ
jgi:dTDP-4-dehydrorhamnose reductase